MLVDDGLEILTKTQCEGLLAVRTLGRIGVTIGGLPAIFPVNYAYVDGNVVFRTSPGAKLRAASRGIVIAFEIDGYDAITQAGWSVLVVGRAAEILDETERDHFLASSVSPWVGGERERYVRVDGEIISGRRIVGVNAARETHHSE